MYLKGMGKTNSLCERETMQAFNVYKGSKLIDTVFYGKGVKVDKDEVRQSLINHDGYDADIRVTKKKKKTKVKVAG